MKRELDNFLKRTHQGRTTFSEFFLGLCRETGIPPTREYERELERELESKGLLSDGTVARGVRGRTWSATDHIEDEKCKVN